MRRLHRGLALAILLSCGTPPPAAKAPAIAAASVVPSEQAVVTASRGKVELLRANELDWALARVGDRLSVADALRTDLGEADLAIGGVRVHLHESSRLQIEKVTARHLSAKVRGSIESNVDDKNRLDVRFDGSDATAFSEGGTFFATADGRGVVAVASVTGTVRLSSGGKDVDVKTGQVSRVADTAAPTAPAAALRRVLLSVKWPHDTTNQPVLPLAGTVEPGSRVFVQGQPVVVEPAGSFRTEVPLKKGKQKVSVLTIDALGRRKQVENVVLRDDSLPAVKVKKKLWQWR